MFVHIKHYISYFFVFKDMKKREQLLRMFTYCNFYCNLTEENLFVFVQRWSNFLQKATHAIVSF